MSTPGPGFWSCLVREWAELRRPAEQCALLWIPLAALVLAWAIFARGVVGWRYKIIDRLVGDE